MIHVQIDKQGFTITGHAGFNPGNDVLCSGISAIAQYAELMLYSFSDVQVKKESGYMDVNVVEVNENTGIIIHNMEILLQNLQEDYPNHISVERLDDNEQEEL